MARQRNSSHLSAVLVVVGCLWLLSGFTFVPAATGRGRSLRAARGAAEKEQDDSNWAPPARRPTMNPNNAVKLGFSMDQDKRGNAWQMELEPIGQEEDDWTQSWVTVAAGLVIVPPIVLLLAKFGPGTEDGVGEIAI